MTLKSNEQHDLMFLWAVKHSKFPVKSAGNTVMHPWHTNDALQLRKHRI